MLNLRRNWYLKIEHGLNPKTKDIYNKMLLNFVRLHFFEASTGMFSEQDLQIGKHQFLEEPSLKA